jgi:hypothetical protein
MNSKPKNWQNYEELARHVLLHFADIVGISSVEVKQRLQGRSGTCWQIDAKGICSDGAGFLVIECKERKSSRLNQRTIAALAFTVRDVGATGAVIITSIGLQKGAKKVASQLGLHEMYLPKESTFEDFVAKCGNRVFHKLPPVQVGCSASIVSGMVCNQKQGKI